MKNPAQWLCGRPLTFSLITEIQRDAREGMVAREVVVEVIQALRNPTTDYDQLRAKHPNLFRE